MVEYPWQVYVVQVIYGIGAAFSYPSWMALFTRHIDNHEEGLEWSVYYTTTDLGTAITAGIGGVVAASFGYDIVFFVVGLTSLIGTAFLVFIQDHLYSK